MPDKSTSDLIDALEEIERAASENLSRTEEIGKRAKHLRTKLESGENLVELVEAEPTPRMVELLTDNMTTLETAGATFRAAEAIALREKGLTIEAIASLFGVTRQRVSALLKQKAAQEL